MSLDSNFWDNLDVEAFGADFVQKNIHHFIDLDEENPSKKRRLGRTSKINYWETKWGQMLLNPLIKDPASKLAKKFRRRFRVPYPLFSELLVPECKRVNLFNTTFENMIRVPIEFKILIALRILGRGNVFDDLEELAESR